MKLALNKPKKTPSKIPKNTRPRYFFKYGQQNEYNLKICDTAIFCHLANGAAFQRKQPQSSIQISRNPEIKKLRDWDYLKTLATILNIKVDVAYSPRHGQIGGGRSVSLFQPFQMT